jgi:hypothetical protein
MHRHHTFLLVLALLALGACSRVSTTAPTAPPAPTATSTPKPTATVQPTPTPRPNESLYLAIEQAHTLDTYRMAFTFGAGADASASPQLDYMAAFRAKDLMFRFAMPPQAEGQPSTLSVVTVDGVTYAHGPLPIQGAEQPIWYTLGTKPPTTTQPLFTVAKLLDMLTSRIDLGTLKADGSEDLDGQACSRYRGGLEAALGMADSLGRPTTPEAQAAEATPVVQRMQAQGFVFDDASALLWVCPDGLLHRIRAEVQGSSPQEPGSPLLLRLTFDLSEVGGPITIVPPIESVAPGISVPLATVFNGGNMRAQPNTDGEVLDQIHARESVRLLAKTADARWYRIVNPRDLSGWVSATLLKIDPALVKAVPVAEGS